MADLKISALTALTGAGVDSAADLIPIVDTSATTTKSITPSELRTGIGAQPLDATLTALAGVTTAADKLIYATGSDTFTTTDLTSTARSLLDDTSTSAMRTTLGLAIGTDVQAYDADLATIAGLTATTDNFIQAKSSAWASRTPAQVAADLQGTGLVADMVGFRNIPQNSQSAAYTTVAADSGKHILHPASDANARTFTIDSNANVAYPIGTAITFINMSANALTIAITSDTMYLIGAGTTGSRTLAQYGSATAIKISSTSWVISGVNLT